jgi:histidyl-tRNA synthetase
MELANCFAKEERAVYLIPIGKEAEEYALTLANELRRNGLYVIYEYSGTLKTRMKKANQADAKVALIFGDEELNSKTLKVKNMDLGEEKTVARSNIIKSIHQVYGKNRKRAGFVRYVVALLHPQSQTPVSIQECGKY